MPMTTGSSDSNATNETINKDTIAYESRFQSIFAEASSLAPIVMPSDSNNTIKYDNIADGSVRDVMFSSWQTEVNHVQALERRFNFVTKRIVNMFERATLQEDRLDVDRISAQVLNEMTKSWDITMLTGMVATKDSLGGTVPFDLGTGILTNENTLRPASKAITTPQEFLSFIMSLPDNMMDALGQSNPVDNVYFVITKDIADKYLNEMVGLYNIRNLIVERFGERGEGGWNIIPSYYPATTSIMSFAKPLVQRYNGAIGSPQSLAGQKDEKADSYWTRFAYDTSALNPTQKGAAIYQAVTLV